MKKIAMNIGIGSAVALCVACSSSENPPPRVPTDNNVYVGIFSPPDLSSNIAPDYGIYLEAQLPENNAKIAGLTDPSAALKNEIEQAFSLFQTPSTSVAGQFKWSSLKKVSCVFQPSAVLKPGAYVAELTESKQFKVLQGRAKSRFWVGSMPRVSRISFSRNAGLVEYIDIVFSEAMKDLSSHISLAMDGKTLTPTKSTFAGEGTSALLELSVSSDKKLTITISGSAMSKAGSYLDANYTGIKTSPGPDFVLEVVPDQVKDGKWVPST